FINAENAEKIGLFPDGLADKLTVAGNTALSGASLILLSKENAGNVIKNARELSLSESEFFKTRYIERMAI
ncbi:MAG: ASKHA domain-containing protein, partial [Bacillota bacterium]|nr:ASKHA domain-containing protein [Bacillota bacterium]